MVFYLWTIGVSSTMLLLIFTGGQLSSATTPKFQKSRAVPRLDPKASLSEAVSTESRIHRSRPSAQTTSESHVMERLQDSIDLSPNHNLPSQALSVPGSFVQSSRKYGLAEHESIQEQLLQHPSSNEITYLNRIIKTDNISNHYEQRLVRKGFKDFRRAHPDITFEEEEFESEEFHLPKGTFAKRTGRLIRNTISDVPVVVPEKRPSNVSK